MLLRVGESCLPFILDMGEGEAGLDTDGPDLYVEDVDGEDGAGEADPYRVFASNDRVDWVDLEPTPSCFIGAALVGGSGA